MKKILKYALLILILLLAGSIGIILLRPSHIISKEEAKKEYLQPNSHFIHWHGADVHYVDEGQGLPVLMIHGFGGNFRNFQKLADSMKSDYRVIRVDLPGFGLSDYPADLEAKAQFLTDYRDFLSEFIDSLHLDSLYVIGNSMGGGMAWLIAGDHPDKVKKLVLLDAAGYDMKKVAGGLFVIKYKAFAHIFDKGMPLFLSKSGAENCFSDKSKVDYNDVYNNNRITNREGNLQHVFAMARAAMGNNADVPDTALIKRIQCPTLIIWGKNDNIIPVVHAEKFHRDIAGSQLLIFDSCGHVPMVEQTAKTNGAIRKFFNE